MSPAFKPLLPLALASLLSTFAAPATAADVTYTLDPSHTQVQFNWAHMGYSHPGGDFDTISGSLKWNAADISKSSVKVNIAVDSIHTRVAALDEELRGDKFFDTAKFPTITFTSTKVERGAKAGRFKVTGDLSLHGVTKPVVLDVTLNQQGIYPMLKLPALGFDASTHIKRSDFGLGYGVPMVGDDVQVRITVEAMEAEGYAKAMKEMAK
ncbi:MAG TPA: YceI family protein [Arenimonas sp.]|uniref:YceI family protein n=1 Tax=Arenimonas sp. TaxID=1872635 RepID=UPI002BBBB80A|nr:YceI family protein [Arenimonas sp.]HMB56756.1 YceI family protein [Arenimonas sp.]